MASLTKTDVLNNLAKSGFNMNSDQAKTTPQASTVGGAVLTDGTISKGNNPVSGVGGAVLDNGTISQNGSVAITPESLAPTKSVSVPATLYTSTAIPSLDSAVTSSVNTNQARLNDAAMAAASNVASDKVSLTDTANKIIDIQSGSEQAKQDAGIYDKAQKVNDYTNRLEALQRKQLNRIRALEGTTLTDAQKQAQINEINRQSSFEQADVALLQSAANRDLATATAILDQKTAAALEPLKTKLQLQETFYNDNKDLFTKADERAYQNLVNDTNRQYQEQKDFSDRKNQILLSIIGNKDLNSSPALISALSNATNESGLDNVLILAGTTRQKIAETEAMQKVPLLQDKLTQIDSLKSDLVGLASAVGPNWLYRADPSNFITGARENFIAGVEQLISKETLDTLVNLKAQGGTLGALSEKELQMLNGAASKIGTWAIRDKGGNITGYRTTEKNFVGELDVIKSLAERAIGKAYGYDLSNQELINAVPTSEVTNEQFFGVINTR